MCSDSGTDVTTTTTQASAPHDCSRPKDPVLPPSDDDLAESYGLGHPGSEAARLGMSVVRNGPNFVGR